jgi:hypothetical protein
MVPKGLAASSQAMQQKESFVLGGMEALRNLGKSAGRLVNRGSMRPRERGEAGDQARRMGANRAASRHHRVAIKAVK